MGLFGAIMAVFYEGCYIQHYLVVAMVGAYYGLLGIICGANGKVVLGIWWVSIWDLWLLGFRRL